MLTISEIWDLILAQEETDKPIKLKCTTQEEAKRIKTMLSSYKHRVLSRHEDLREALGEFRLNFTIEYPEAVIKDTVVLQIEVTFDTSGSREVHAELL